VLQREWGGGEGGDAESFEFLGVPSEVVQDVRREVLREVRVLQSLRCQCEAGAIPQPHVQCPRHSTKVIKAGSGPPGSLLPASC